MHRNSLRSRVRFVQETRVIIRAMPHSETEEPLQQDPFGGWVFVFRNRRATAVKVLVYDGQGFWLCHKRLSSGRFQWWPRDESQASQTLAAHQLQVLLSAGNPASTQAAPDWRPVSPRS